MNLAVIAYHNNGGLKLFTPSVRVRGKYEYLLLLDILLRKCSRFGGG